MNNLIIQLIGAIAYIILAYSYFKKNKREILFLQIFSTIAFAIHYYLLNGITGSICSLISIIIIIILYFFEKNECRNKRILILFIIPFLTLISLFTYENIYSIFPIIGSIIVLISFVLSNENIIRIAGIISPVCWLIYSIIYKSYVAIFFETFSIISTFIAFYKNRNNKKTLKQLKL